MHSLAPYTIRCHDPEYYRLNRTYSPLDKVKNLFDTYELLKEFLGGQGVAFRNIEAEKKVYRFVDINCDDATRIVTGRIQQGHYGFITDIINVDTGNIDYAKTEKNAELMVYYFHIKIEPTYNEGLAMFQVFRNVSVKTLFHNLFSEFFRAKTALMLQMNTLTYDKSLEKWQEAVVEEIRAIKFQGLAEREQRIAGLGHAENMEVSISIKPAKKGLLGKLKNYVGERSEKLVAVELLEGDCQKVKTVVSLNGKSRTFTLGRNRTAALCEVEAPDDLLVVGGLPTLPALKNWFNEMDQEFTSNLYPNRPTSP